MPRNRNKVPCQVPGCRNWAMRGHTRCRAHRDLELGPRGGGAPPGNLNALRTGDHAQPFPAGDLASLARELVADPQHLPQHLGPLLASIHARAGDPYKTLIALQAALGQLLPLVAQHLFIAECDDLLRRLPPHQRSAVAAVVRKYAPFHDPAASLSLLRGLAARLSDHLLPDHPQRATLRASAGQQPPDPVPLREQDPIP